MSKIFAGLSFCFLLFILILLTACSNTGELPAVASNATSEKPVTIIVPLPLPTTLPDQQARLEEASKNRVTSVDFVIDAAELETRSIPYRFAQGENWYKYTSQDGAYSVLLFGSERPTRLVDFEAVVFNNPVKYQAVYADDPTGLATNAVSTFSHPQLVSGKLTPEEYLELLANSLPDGAIIPTRIASVNIINQDNIQLEDYPGRDFIIEVLPNEGGNASFIARLRVYVVGNTVYQLYAANVLNDTTDDNENTVRFLNSFTLNDAGGE